MHRNIGAWDKTNYLEYILRWNDPTQKQKKTFSKLKVEFFLIIEKMINRFCFFYPADAFKIQNSTKNYKFFVQYAQITVKLWHYAFLPFGWRLMESILRCIYEKMQLFWWNIAIFWWKNAICKWRFNKKTICIRKNRIVSRTRLEPKNYSYKKARKKTQESANFQLKKNFQQTEMVKQTMAYAKQNKQFEQK